MPNGSTTVWIPVVVVRTTRNQRQSSAFSRSGHQQDGRKTESASCRSLRSRTQEERAVCVDKRTAAAPNIVRSWANLSRVAITCFVIPFEK